VSTPRVSRPSPFSRCLFTTSRALCFLVLACAAYAQSAFVRVNQVGYVSGGAKRAYLMSSATETGATFAVKNSSGTTVYSAAIGAKLGSWSNGYPDVYALDFDSVMTAGSYTITVSGPIAASSPSFKIDSATNVYSSALANSLYFYQNERDGNSTTFQSNTFISTPLRSAPGHLNDQAAKVYLTPNMNSSGRFSGDLSPATFNGSQVTINAEGGWWDAGDYMKFVQTHSYTVALMLIGVRDFPNQMGATGVTQDGLHFTDEAKFGLDWLSEMWDDTNEILYYQVAIGNGNAKTISDHDIWRLPQADDTYNGCSSQYRYICHRPVFVNTAAVNSSAQIVSKAPISPNLAGRLVADFALCYRVYASSNSTYANQCLSSAEHIFALANTNPSSLLTVAPNSFYPETEWRDDMELGATELYFALQSCGTNCPGPNLNPASYYLQQAATWANAYVTGPNDAADTLNLYDVSGLAHFELYRAISLAGNPSGLATTQAALVADLQKQLNKAIAQSATDPFGFGFPWNVYDTTSHGGGLAVMAAEYSFLNGPALNNFGNSNSPAVYAGRQLANVLGANSWGASLIVGNGTTFPLCMQHQVTNLVPKPPDNVNGPFLSGAAVEGPNGVTSNGTLSGMVACPTSGVDVYSQFNNTKAVFKDFVQSFPTVEPAIDLTASSFLAFAWQMAGAPTGTP
jgi:endoglucanase